MNDKHTSYVVTFPSLKLSLCVNALPGGAFLMIVTYVAFQSLETDSIALQADATYQMKLCIPTYCAYHAFRIQSFT